MLSIIIKLLAEPKSQLSKKHVHNCTKVWPCCEGLWRLAKLKQCGVCCWLWCMSNAACKSTSLAYLRICSTHINRIVAFYRKKLERGTLLFFFFFAYCIFWPKKLWKELFFREKGGGIQKKISESPNSLLSARVVIMELPIITWRGGGGSMINRWTLRSTCQQSVRQPRDLSFLGLPCMLSNYIIIAVHW